MLKHNCVWDNKSSKFLVSGFWFNSKRETRNCQRWIAGIALGALAGCATPQYAVRPTPMPEESAEAVQIEQAISEVQAKEFQQQGARPVGFNEQIAHFPVQDIVSRLSRVTERPGLPYRSYVYQSKDPNAAALADGRIYISSGMFDYLASRGSRADELAFILGHELGHTVAQHLVKRYRYLQQQQMWISLAQAGVAVATRGKSAGAQEAGRVALNAASLLQNVAVSGYSQEQELEADQLGVRYMTRAGFDPYAALDLLRDFARFDTGSMPFLRTHPYMTVRQEYIARYLAETGTTPTESVPARMENSVEARKRELQQIQKLYPKRSVSWINLQHQIEALDTQ